MNSILVTMGGAFLLAAGLVLTALVVCIIYLALREFSRTSQLDCLQERYTISHTPQEMWYKKQSVMIGAVRYRHVVDVSIQPEGLYLWVRTRLKNQPPMCIPWSEIHAPQPASIYQRRAQKMQIGSPRVAEVTIGEDLFQFIEPYLGGL